mmetsp:Transcript_18345/g.51127  ORF Transcript_18345/g.51127 Transcript_18345/m.51127 type:complete len:328 (+) Transcript_18345:203-1186(+)
MQPIKRRQHHTHPPHRVRNPLNGHGQIHETQRQSKRNRALHKQVQEFLVAGKDLSEPPALPQHQPSQDAHHRHRQANADARRLFRPVRIHVSEPQAHVDGGGRGAGIHKNEGDPHDPVGRVEDGHVDLSHGCRDGPNHGGPPKVGRSRECRRKVESGEGPDPFPGNLVGDQPGPARLVEPLHSDADQHYKGDLNVRHGGGDQRAKRKAKAAKSRNRPSQDQRQAQHKVGHQSHCRGGGFRPKNLLGRKKLREQIEGNDSGNGEAEQPRVGAGHGGDLGVAPKPEPDGFGEVPEDDHTAADRRDHHAGHLDVDSRQLWIPRSDGSPDE